MAIALFAGSTAVAQVHPGYGIEFVERNDSTWIALTDSVARDVIYVGPLAARGHFIFEATGCIDIEVGVAPDSIRIDTLDFYPADTMIVGTDTLIAPGGVVTREVYVNVPDTVRLIDKCSPIAAFNVPLGCMDSLQVQIPVDTTLVYCDSACRMWLPHISDSIYVKINGAEFQTLLSWQQQLYSISCDTSREGRGGTITGVKDSFGNWVFDIKERRSGWPRKTPVGYLPGSSDTCQIRYSLLSMFYPVGHTAYHDTSWVDSVLTQVDCANFINGPYASRLIVDTVCVTIPQTVLVYRDVPVWVPAGRDTVIYVDTTLFKCPKFTVSCVTGYLDTTKIVTNHYDIQPIWHTDTVRIPNCIDVVPYTPIYETMGVQNYTQFANLDSALTVEKRALHGCDSAAGKEPVLVRRYIEYPLGSGIWIWRNLATPKRFCNFTLNDWLTYQRQAPLYPFEEWCWLPMTTIDSIQTTNCQFTCTPLSISGIPEHWGNCARKDTTIVYYCPDPITGLPQPYFHTYEIEDKDADTTVKYGTYLVGLDSTLISSDTATVVRWVYYATPQYVVDYEDTCVCEDVFHVANGDVPICNPWIENPCDPLNPIYWTMKPNGEPVINICIPPIEITLNGWKRSHFEGVVFDSTLDRRIWILTKHIDSSLRRIDSMMNVLLNCCSWPDSLQLLRTQVDSLQAELAACCASKPDFGALTLGGDGTAVLDASDSCIIITSYADNSGTAGDDPVTVYHDGSQWKFVGAADRVINYVIKCP